MKVLQSLLENIAAKVFLGSLSYRIELSVTGDFTV